MLRHYFIIGLRSLMRERLHTVINLVGLGIGMACALLIYLFIANEWSYDRFHTNADRIFRPALKESYSEQEQYFNTVTPFPMAAALKEQCPEVIEAVRIMDRTDIVRANDKSFSERYHVADPAVFSVFTFPLVAGDSATALTSPTSCVISERMAKKYFGDRPAMGETVSIQVDTAFADFTVTGVVKDIRGNSSVRFDIVISTAILPRFFSERTLSSWTNVFGETYVFTRPGTTPAQLESQIPAMVQRIMGEKYVSGAIGVLFQPLRDIHLDTNYPAGIEPTGNPAYSYILGSIAAAVLLIACINFMTLAVARAARRAREVGIRKVSGAGRAQLLRQFWGETLLLSLFALLLAFALAEFALPLFNSVAGKDLSLTFRWDVLLFVIGLTAVVSLVGGSYPGLIMAGFRPVHVLKGSVGIQGNPRLRQALVILQFTVAIALIICTFAMTRQMNYLLETPLGFSRSQVMVVGTNVDYDRSLRISRLLRQELIPSGAASHVSFATNALGEPWYTIGWKASPNDYRTAVVNRIDPEFLPALGIRLIEGRNFSLDHPADSINAVLINETFARTFNMTAPVGKPLPGTLSGNIVVGVVEDFHFESLHAPIQPLILTLSMPNVLRSVQDVNTSASGNQRLHIRSTLPPAAAVAAVQSAWVKVAGDLPFESHFLDDLIERQYQADRRLGELISYASILVVVISCLGLYGLAAISVVRRTKEISVRKVLGASSSGIITLVSREAVVLVLIANVIAWPIAWFAVDRWLQDFAYRTSIGVGSFLWAALVALAVALATVGYHSVKAALANPADALRYE